MIGFKFSFNKEYLKYEKKKILMKSSAINYFKRAFNSEHSKIMGYSPDD